MRVSDEDSDGGDRSLGELVRKHRRAAGLTQHQLADAAGVSLGMVRDLEQRITTRPRVDSVRRLAAALGIGNWQTGKPVRPRHAIRQRPPGRPGRVPDDDRLALAVLGPLTVAWRGHPVPLGYDKSRAVLALLALYPNTVVHRDTIVDALWADRPPATAVTMVQGYVSRLRRLLSAVGPTGDARLIGSGSGYQLHIDADELDMLRFNELAGQAADARLARALHSASARYARALALWRGEPLVDVEALRTHPAVANLNHRYAALVTGYAEVTATLGCPEQALPALRELTAREPLNERAQARLIIALAGSGYPAAAMRAYHDVRRRLDDELGARPSAELADAYQRVLRGFPDAVSS
jgi:DNA-binding SARP family transcriptional activator/DNA-binding XRE family transcriptional regulator